MNAGYDWSSKLFPNTLLTFSLHVSPSWVNDHQSHNKRKRKYLENCFQKYESSVFCNSIRVIQKLPNQTPSHVSGQFGVLSIIRLNLLAGLRLKHDQAKNSISRTQIDLVLTAWQTKAAGKIGRRKKNAFIIENYKTRKTVNTWGASGVEASGETGSSSQENKQTGGNGQIFFLFFFPAKQLLI